MSNTHPSDQTSVTLAPFSVTGTTGDSAPDSPVQLQARITHLLQQLDEVRKLNHRLEMMNAALLTEKGSLRYRIVDELYGILKRRTLLQKLHRWVLPLSMRTTWHLRRRAAKKAA
jgi:hypothetical protein